jgi:thiol-disulfide isomerase/thioredoxin
VIDKIKRYPKQFAFGFLLIYGKTKINMKNIIIILAAIFMNGNLFSQGIKFEHGTFDEAMAKAQKENKLVFIDCYTTWCAPCKRLSKNVFTQKKVGDFFNKNFINVKLDCEKGEGLALASKYGVSVYPTLLFIDADGYLENKLLGAMQADDLIAGAKITLDPEMRLSVFDQKYDNGNRDYKFLMDYLKVLHKRVYDRKKMTIVSREIIKQSSLYKYMNKHLFYVIAAANYSYGTEEFNYLLKNRNQVKEMKQSFEYRIVFFDNIYAHLSEHAKVCKSLTELDNEIQKCNKEFPIEDLATVKKSLEETWTKHHQD